MNPPYLRPFLLFVLISSHLGGAMAGAPAADGDAKHRGPGCAGVDDYFLDEVWTKVAAQSCLKCHRAGGDAEESKFVLQDPSRIAEPERGGALQRNRAAFGRMAALQNGGKSRLLLKATGALNHEGEEVLKPDSTGYRILAEYVRRANIPQHEKPGHQTGLADQNEPPFLQGIAMLDDRKLLRRVTLSLAARLPATKELQAVEKQGLEAIGPILDAVMQEAAFYERLAEAFNDIFLTRGYGLAEDALSYEDFGSTRRWTQKHDLAHIADEGARKQAKIKLAADYSEALLREPLELIKHIVRHDRPFTEIVTADYIMISPYTARGYGIYDDLREKFQNPEDPFEYIPVRLKALKKRSGKDYRPSETGFYPHAGIRVSSILRAGLW